MFAIPDRCSCILGAEDNKEKKCKPNKQNQRLSLVSHVEKVGLFVAMLFWFCFLLKLPCSSSSSSSSFSSCCCCFFFQLFSFSFCSCKCFEWFSLKGLLGLLAFDVLRNCFSYLPSTGKRKCNGKIPCERCVRLNKADTCESVTSTATTKRKRTDDSEENPLALSIPEPQKNNTWTEKGLDGAMGLMMSMMMSNSVNLLRDRPKDITLSFGLNLENFIALEVNPLTATTPEMIVYQWKMSNIAASYGIVYFRF